MMITADGSPTLFVPELNETYHSTYGAVSEAMHVYIESGLCSFPEVLKEEYNIDNPPSLRILEVGFGTGLNALLTLMTSGALGWDIYYEAIEKFPLTKKEAAGLSYLSRDIELQHLHSAKWEKAVKMKFTYIDKWWIPGNWLLPVEVEPHFTLRKRHVDLLEYKPKKKFQTFDIIYFDAFAPTIQPELWTEEVFRKMYEILVPGGVLLTYSAAGSVKTALRAAGFKVERLPGAAGKHHMLRATKVIIY